MLLFSTLLPIKPSLTPDAFISLILDWNNGHTHPENIIPNIKWNGEKNIRYGNESLWLEIREYAKEDILAVRYEKNQDNRVYWDTDYIMNFRERKMAVSLSRSYQSAYSAGTEFSTPHFISMLARKGYIEKDRDLPISNKPIQITEKAIPTLAALINGESEYALPVVYVSKTPLDEDPVDTDFLASRLKGVAHVLVESAKWLDAGIRRQCGSRNEYNGAIGLYFPKGTLEHKRFYYNAFDGTDNQTMESVIRKIIQFSNQQKIDPLYTWDGVVNSILAESSRQQETRFQQVRNESNDLIQYADEEIKNLKNTIQELLIQNNRLKSENEGLRARQHSAQTPLLYYGKESEYQGEIRDKVLEVLTEYLSNGATQGTRRYDIIRDILDSNPYEGILKKKTEAVRSILTNYKGLTAKTRQELMRLGFTIEEGSHYKLLYLGDDRYISILSKTPSERSSGDKNAISQLINKTF
ncbi:MAG: hypothetical protein IJU20_03645 [Clostridia bacterium]|nr:hypothetical protein [Clostridia bacterium]